MTEVLPGVHLLKLPLPIPDTSLTHVNVYLVRGDDGYLMVDAGWNTNQALESLEAQLAGLGLVFEDIAQIVVTHIHPDHYGLAGRLKQFSGAQLLMHRVDSDLIDSRYVHVDTLLGQLARWLSSHGVPASELPELQKASVGMIQYVAPTYPDVTLQGGETLPMGAFNLRVLPTPGHSPGHICLYDPDRKLLFSGDHLLPTITPNIGLHPQSSPDPVGDYIKSLVMLKGLDISLVLPGHEEPFSGVTPRIDGLSRHHQRRDSEILEALSASPRTAYLVSQSITWLPESGGASWQSLRPLHRRLAVLETAAHLESMRIDGRVKADPRDGVIYYRRNGI
ncbi:MAG: MBL fold metallo-hydrolase [Chloroflexi bacterium]|nr:MBL fold metallo-hydrolase [Chloroflexota bacterium]